ncbi:hypothetical protein BJ138DRAFT_1113038 [Hygrophoropsis aurantiaca]|uniref:Uncharacterized protein n=1 Tax=Hygrophoropsis aurantiaca TaxID=72124 RepID=A0ACB8AGJ2_9AGAM|nr:hypothetical protein BJ138DRAFT_1113038 [Hygrophoropsis aurantiaca]
MVLLAAARMVPNIEWPVEVDVSEIYTQLGNVFKGCFVSMADGIGLTLAPFAQNRAVVFGRALLHLFCSRLYLWSIVGGVPLCDQVYNLSLLDCFACLATFGKDHSAPFLGAMAYTLLAGDGYLLSEGVPFPTGISESDHVWALHLLPHLLAHPYHPIKVKRLAVREIIRWLAPTSPVQQILIDCSLSVAIMLGMPVDQKDLVTFDISSMADMFLRKYLRQSGSVSEVTSGDSKCRQEFLLLTLAAVLERHRIYLTTGKCDSKTCLCDKIDYVMLSYTSYMSRGLEASEPDIRTEMLQRARAALRLGAILSAVPRHDHQRRDRWNPTYLGHPVRFIIDEP